MGKDLLVSAIIPTYNRSNIVVEAIDSILSQTYRNIEIIVVDDGSTDDTRERLRRYGNRIRMISQQNAGPGIARNRGIAAARGELIAFLDSDDLWLPTKIERQVLQLQKAGQSVPCSLANIVMRSDNMEVTSFDISLLNPALEEGIWLNVDDILATRFVLFNQAVVIRRAVLDQMGGFDESLRFQEDYDLPLRLSLEGPWAFIREPLVIWRESKTGSVYKSSQREEVCCSTCTVQVFEKHLAMVQDSCQRRYLQRQVNRGLRKARRELRIAKMKQTNSFGASSIAALLRSMEVYRNAAFRRSPWFPKMKVQPLSSYVANEGLPDGSNGK